MCSYCVQFVQGNTNSYGRLRKQEQLYVVSGGGTMRWAIWSDARKNNTHIKGELYVNFVLSNILLDSGGMGTRNSARNIIFRYPESAKKWGKLIKAFLDFYQIFAIFDDFSKWNALGLDRPWGLPNLRTSNMFDTSLPNCLRTVRRTSIDIDRSKLQCQSIYLLRSI